MTVTVLSLVTVAAFVAQEVIMVLFLFLCFEFLPQLILYLYARFYIVAPSVPSSYMYVVLIRFYL